MWRIYKSCEEYTKVQTLPYREQNNYEVLSRKLALLKKRPSVEILSSFNSKPRVICDQQCKLKANDAYREDKLWICHCNVDRQLDRFTSLLGCGAASIGYWRQSSSDVAPDPRRMESSSALRKRKNSRNCIIYCRQQIVNKFGKCNNRWNVHLFCRK